MNEKLISQIKKYVNSLLWPLENHYYHHYEHALEVMNRSLELWQKENLPDEDLELLAIAGLFHDVGFIIQYDNNEYIGAKIAKNYLKWVLYPEEKIQKVEDLIIATIYTRPPNNLMEKIIRDADTDNLGRDDFFEKWQRLKKEIEIMKKIKILDPDWHHYSLNFLREHNFLTPTEIEERQEKKEENIRILSQKIQSQNTSQ